MCEGRLSLKAASGLWQQELLLCEQAQETGTAWQGNPNGKVLISQVKQCGSR